MADCAALLVLAAQRGQEPKASALAATQPTRLPSRSGSRSLRVRVTIAQIGGGGGVNARQHQPPSRRWTRRRWCACAPKLLGKVSDSSLANSAPVVGKTAFPLPAHARTTLTPFRPEYRLRRRTYAGIAAAPLRWWRMCGIRWLGRGADARRRRGLSGRFRVQRESLDAICIMAGCMGEGACL